MSTTAPLIDYLRQLARQGTTHVALDERAREVLRSYLRKPAAKKKPAAYQPSGGSSPRLADLPDDSEGEAAIPAPTISGETAEEKLASLREQAANWAPARQLGTLRDTMVFAVGNPHADLMLVGEAPGYNEEMQREPFVGKAGQKLNQILKAMELERSEVYISNICKFRPAMARNQGTANRKPSREEMDACLPFVRAEIALVQPRCLVALGATAAEGLLHTDLGVGKLRGSWYEFEGIPVRVTYHPSYLLHNEHASGEKRKVWDDMLTVMEKLGMPISERQRGFFR